MTNLAGLTKADHKAQTSLPGQPNAEGSTGRILIEIRISEHSKVLFSHGICPTAVAGL